MLNPGSFEIRSDTLKPRGVCRKCRIEQITRWQNENREQTRVNQRRYNRTFNGRAIILLNAAKSRAAKRGEEFSITIDDVMSRMSLGKCCKTGVLFEYDNTVGGTQSPYAPSIDKIDPQGVYEPSNIQIVSFWYNSAKQQWPENIVIQMCRKLIENFDANT